MHSFKPPTEQELERRKLVEQERQKQLELALEEKHRLKFQKDLSKNETILSSLFELVLQPSPKLGAKYNIKAGFANEEKFDGPKADVIQAAALQLMNTRGPIKDNDLNNPEYLNQLVVHLVKTMVVNHTLKNNPGLTKLLDEQKKLMETFANEVKGLANNLPKPAPDPDFNKQIAKEDAFKKEQEGLENLADCLKNNKPQKEIDDALKELQSETLKKLQGPMAELFKKTDELTHKLIEDMGKNIQKEVDAQLNKSLKVRPPELKPSGSSKKESDSDNETAELRDNPYANLTGLRSDQQGSIPITIYSNIGNGLGLINSIRASISTSTENVDAGHTAKTQLAGQVGGFGGEEEGITQFNSTSANSFQAQMQPQLAQSGLSQPSTRSPFDTRPKNPLDGMTPE